MWVPYQLKEAHTPIGNWVGLVSIYPSTRLDFDWVGFNSSIRWKKRGREGKGRESSCFCYSVLEALVFP
jgi:hypothetical protein